MALPKNKIIMIKYIKKKKCTGKFDRIFEHIYFLFIYIINFYVQFILLLKRNKIKEKALIANSVSY